MKSPEHPQKKAKSARFKDQVSVNGHAENDHIDPGSEALSSSHSKLPNINSTSRPGVTKETETSGDVNKAGSDENVNKSESDEDNELLTQLGKIMEDEPVEGFRDVHVSPVQTPLLQRPITREQTRLVLNDRIKEVLEGHIHRTCPVDSKVLRLYVCAGFTGKS